MHTYKFFSGYDIYGQIHENSRVVVYRGYSVKDRMPVVIKALKKEAAGTSELSRLIHAYETVRNLASVSGLVEPIRMERDGALAAIVMRDEGAVSLREKMRLDGLFDMGRFLPIAVRLATILSEIHRNGVIHLDVHPGNILVSPDERQVFLIDFGNAAFLPPGEGRMPARSHSAETPAYMSPEQIGRLHAAVDRRSDLYSLGVVFYQMITGIHPFEGEHAGDLAYAHLTRTPKAPHDVMPGLSKVLSAIVMKLLRKDPEERYQSANGLLKDLEECRRQWLEAGVIAEVSVGKTDEASRLRFPDDFYGRQSEIRLLRKAYDRVCEGEAEIVFVSGEPGIGKTFLIHESLKSAAEEKGFFITGKADQLRSNIPYAPFAQAFGRLIRQLLTEDEERLLRWKQTIRDALGKHGAVLLGILPELEWIIGRQPSAQSLAPQEAENRFQRVFRDFVRGLARIDHPLVLFLDDLQWADDASIRLLRDLMRNIRRCPLLIVGAYRDNELHDGHLLRQSLFDSQTGRQATRLHLRPLERRETARFVADTLRAPLELTARLSESLYHRSGGNPFFLRQLLTLLHDEGALYYDHQAGRWQWDERAWRHLHRKEDVKALILAKVRRLTEEYLELLKLASCLGNRFRLQTVAALRDKSAEETAADFLPLIAEGLVTVAEPGSKEQDRVDARRDIEYAFLHDHIQQAVYSLISEQEKLEKHLRIGFLLLDGVTGDPPGERLMSMMDHLNRGAERIRDRKWRIRLARLNLLAGRKAKASVAYSSALRYFRSGMDHLADDAWETHRRLSFRLHLELAQTEFLCEEPDAAEERFFALLKQARTELERADVYGAKVILYAGIGRYQDAVQAGREALRELGMHIPLHPGKWDYVKELLRYKRLMRGRKIEDLAELPEMRGAERKKIMEISTRLSYVCMASYPDLFGLIIIKNGNFALRHGISAISPAGFIGYGLTEGNMLGNYRKAERFSEVCIRLAEKYGGSAIKSIIYFVTGSLLSHWTRDVSHGLDCLNRALEYGLEAGDVVIIGYAHCMLLEHRYLAGIPLAELDGEIRRKRQAAELFRHDNLAVNTIIYSRVADALLGRQSDSLESGARKLERDEPLFAAQNDRTVLATSWFHRMMLYYLMDKPEMALDMANRIRPMRGIMNGLLITADYTLLHSLAISAVYEERSPLEQRRFRKQLKRNGRRLGKWADFCKDNFEHKSLLAAAETARLRGRNEAAMRLYDRAIASARRYGFLQYEAMASELAAKFYLALGRTRIAGLYMREASRLYRRWGASAVAERLENRYPELSGEQVAPPEAMRRTEADSAAAAGSESSHSDVTRFVVSRFGTSGADAAERTNDILHGDETHSDQGWAAYFIDQALDVLAAESDSRQLLEKLLAIALRSFGADKGCLIIEQDGELYVEALKDTASGTTVIDTIPLGQVRDLARTIVQYVARTSETVVINKGEPGGIFAGDPHLAESHPKSVACVPLLLQGVPFGVLYLENNAMPGLFDPRHLKVFRLLSAQIAYVRKVLAFLEGDGASAGAEDDAEPNAPVESLTDRELEVLDRMGRGLSNKEIAENLEMSINTVKTHIKNIYGKLGVNRRVQAVQKAKQLRLL